MQDIQTLITSVGFPIAVCLCFMYYINSTQSKREERDIAREDKLLNELAESRVVNVKAMDVIQTYSEGFQKLDREIQEVKQIVSKQ